ncbi:hypothetical protein GX51_06475 [Blastomyces parvus]|uniref:Carbonic anhydrase n=1 Tax=Blastomyces parvus TaxID=2060905 RepID=A0A2B7WR48_9EURO|nr:hypothetical protein GX51_06475 [Blastomyces parvus]
MLVLTLAILVLLNARAVLSSCAHGTYLLRRATDDDKPIELPNFGYGPFDGPTSWQSLSPDNVLCSSGRSQSPIDVDSTISQVPAGLLRMNVPVQDATFLNLRTTVEVALQGSTTINGREFALEQFHFHTPSEHAMNGECFMAEVHLVHSAIDNPKELVVVALMVQATADHSIRSLDRVLSNIDRISSPGNKTTLPALNIADISSLVNTQPFHTYLGSLTTPPCTEGVRFFILSQPIPMHINIFNSLKAVVGHNARFLQNNNPANQNVLAAACHAIPGEARNNTATRPAMVATSSVRYP